jgi:Xaa-Pro aminopeptidase
MLLDSPLDAPLEMYQQRRTNLYATVQKNEEYSQCSGSIFLFGNFEKDRDAFVQDSSFYYYTGVKEPAAVLEIEHNGRNTLYLPTYQIDRKLWRADFLEPSEKTAKLLGVDESKPLGEKAPGVSMRTNSIGPKYYAELFKSFEQKYEQGMCLLVPSPCDGSDADKVLLNFRVHRPDLFKVLFTINSTIALQRRKKDAYEVKKIRRAVELSCDAHLIAALACIAGASELKVRADAEHFLTCNGAQLAYPTMVGTGMNGTICDSFPGPTLLKKGDLVLVDCGGMVDHYCADITRTFPVGGKFSKRQRELYELVLATQEYVASIAKPGMWLANNKKPEQSLDHLAHAFLKEKGYDQYFTHGIGHSLGLDVHDIGGYLEPLAKGDVFTLEPGIYIPEEGIGIRIEDDYLVTDYGIECLSSRLPKKPEEVERLVGCSSESSL